MYQPYLTTFLLFFFTNLLFAQSEFGAVGSYWQYGYEAHNGDGDGWEVISVERDTIIDGEIHKILHQSFFRQNYFPPIDTISWSGYLGTMFIKNDSVFVNGHLILDFTLSKSDTLKLSRLSPDVDIQVTVDTITTETIDGVDYKKWSVQKYCVHDGFADPYESVTILENVGQIDGYLLWNTDGCTIGGGLSRLSCYKNGDFTYPAGVNCERRLLTNLKEIAPPLFIKTYPNPTIDFLQIESKNHPIHQLTLTNILGETLLIKNNLPAETQIDLSAFDKGFYTLTFQVNQQFFTQKIIKN